MNKYKNQFTLFLIITIILGGLSVYFSNSNNTNLILLSKLFLYLSIPVWIYTCVIYVLGRGHHWLLGIILGLLTFIKGIGLIIMLILPDKNKNKSP